MTPYRPNMRDRIARAWWRLLGYRLVFRGAPRRLYPLHRELGR